MNRPASTRSSRDRLEACLARIEDPAGEGSRAFTKIYADQARAAADAADRRAQLGLSLGALDGRIVSIKDLFDVAGETTTAGSKLRRNAAPASAEAPAIARLRAAGAVIVGKANMTEFAFSGVGINPHYGTPGNPADRSRIPGGSSSGGAVSVADGMAEITIGSDTGGSTRIPAALCGIVGWKPSQSRVPTTGAFTVLCPRQYRPDGRQRRRLRAGRCRDGRRRRGPAHASAAGRTTPWYSTGSAAGGHGPGRRRRF